MKTKILVATHKRYIFPKNSIYFPIQVGAMTQDEDFGYLCDHHKGEHISEKNPFYSEMTAIYWAWKNKFFKDADYCGLVHYRRYFKGEIPYEKVHILSQNEIERYMQQFDILVPKKRNYWIETIEKHYRHAHFSKDFDIMHRVVSDMYPDYIQDFDAVMNGTKLHLYNMFIMSVSAFETYAEWLFPLLFEIEQQVEIAHYDAYQRRVFGFMAERLFNVWICNQQRVNGLKLGEVSVVNIEGENLLKKGFNMIKRKYSKHS